MTVKAGFRYRTGDAGSSDDLKVNVNVLEGGNDRDTYVGT